MVFGRRNACEIISIPACLPKIVINLFPVPKYNSTKPQADKPTRENAHEPPRKNGPEPLQTTSARGSSNYSDRKDLIAGRVESTWLGT